MKTEGATGEPSLPFVISISSGGYRSTTILRASDSPFDSRRAK